MKASPSVSTSANTSTSPPPTSVKPAAPPAETTSSRVPWLSPRIGNGVLSVRANSTSTRAEPFGVDRCAGLVEAEHHLDAGVRADHQRYAALRIEIARDA